MRDDGKVAGEKVRTGDRAATVESGNSQSDGIAANRSREGSNQPRGVPREASMRSGR